MGIRSRDPCQGFLQLDIEPPWNVQSANYLTRVCLA